MLSTKGWNPNTAQAPGGKGRQDKGESSHYPSDRRKTELEREYYDSFRLTRSKPSRIPSGFTQFRNQKITEQESPFFTMRVLSRSKQGLKGKNTPSLNQREK
ncbi:hypothetical protein O181_015135 [Austropuccinia psidii MF-1]|uniref:Uncharacterized protein n=1 Tax=Austropuccinia psidii MF-1 TaxID=1389203 RepID=A0A9Q3GQM1_9BASI|nr:hypothetical protein [Austropuccinia psidii MF-1]